MNTERQENPERIRLPGFRMSDEGLSALVKSSPLGIISVDRDGIIRLWNKAAEKITGWRENELLGRSIKVLSPEDLGEAYDETRRRTLQKEIFTSLPMRATKKDGSIMQISFSAAPLLDEEGHVAGTVAIVFDITEKMELETALKASLEKMNRVVDEIVEALASAVETRDRYTANHQRRVASLACAITEEMEGIETDQMKGIRTAALLHDIGKLHVPFELLNNPGHLNDIEFALIKSHPQAGYDVLKEIEFPWPVARIVQQHHERLDGSGYPAGLEGDNILLEARILAVADVVEAMSSHRPYRPGKGINAALLEITQARGRHYDPRAVDACLALFRKGYVLPDE
ncbi:MAG: HD domain-containing phosphohydrolase [Dissulfurispiraceae bacterium]|jgi:PAS domain S-box-containing protein/putative nucleotidyltransferase with HDIG domain